MAAFDRTYKHVAGVIEARLIEVGLPTLADAVRPGVGRRGRPLKRRPKDRYPDLVERVRAGGQIAVDEAPAKAAGNGSGQDVAVSNVAGNGDAVEETVANAVRNDSAGLEKSEHPFPERLMGDEKSEQPLHKRSAGDEKSRHVVPVYSASDEKSEQPLHKSRTHEASDVVSRFRPSPAVQSCVQDPRRRDLEHRGDVARRPRGRAMSRASVRPAKTEPAWWRRLLRVA